MSQVLYIERNKKNTCVLCRACSYDSPMITQSLLTVIPKCKADILLHRSSSCYFYAMILVLLIAQWQSFGNQTLSIMSGDEMNVQKVVVKMVSWLKMALLLMVQQAIIDNMRHNMI